MPSVTRHPANFAWSALSLTLCLAASSTAQADPIDREGLGADSIALSSMSILSTSPLAAAMAPVAAWDAVGSWSVSFRTGFSHGHISLGERPPGVDIADTVLSAEVTAPWLRGWRPLPSSTLRVRSAQQAPSLATMVALGGVWAVSSRVRLSMVASLPTSQMQHNRSHFIDEREQVFSNALRWTWLDESQQRLDAQGAVLIELHPRLRLGVGVWLGQRVKSEAEVYITSLSGEERSPTNIQTEVVSTLSPSLGLRWQPTDSWALQVNWQGRRSTGIQSVSKVRVRGLDGDDQSERVDVTSLSLGQVASRLDMELAWSQGRLGVAAGATLHQTSTLMSPHSEAIAGGLSDSVSGRLAAQIGLTSSLTLLSSASVRTSAVPSQTGRQNLVDNHLVAGGLGLSWRRITTLGALRFTASWRTTHALARTHTKRSDALDPVFDEFPDSVDPKTGAPLTESHGFQTNNPGFPSYSSAAWTHVWSVAVEVRR